MPDQSLTSLFSTTGLLLCIARNKIRGESMVAGMHAMPVSRARKGI